MAHLGDAEIILLLLAGIYLFECFAWLRVGTVALRARNGRPFQLICSSPLFANVRGGVRFGGAWPWLETFLCEPFPISVDAEGAYSHMATTLSPSGRAPAEGRFVRWSEKPEFRPADTAIVVGQQNFASLGSAHEADYVSQRLNRLARAPAHQRITQIEALLREQTDVDRAAERLQTWRRAALATRVFDCVLFLLTFLAAPLLLRLAGGYRYAWEICWTFLAVYLLCWLLTVVAGWRLHRALHPLATGERRKQAIIAALSPATAMHTLGIAARHALVGIHPLAVAKHVLSTDDFAEFARRTLRDARFPLAPACPSDQREPLAATESFRLALEQALVRLISQCGLDVEQLLVPPEPETPEVRAWCPRCEQQYRVATGDCVDCGWPLVAFAACPTSAA